MLGIWSELSLLRSSQNWCFWSESAQKIWPYLCHLGSKKFWVESDQIWADLIISDQIPLRIPASQQRPPITGDADDTTWINSKSTTATRIQAEINQQKVLPLEEQIPKEFHEFLDVFSEEKAARFPESRTWDHKIELKETFVPKSFKTYNLTPEEQSELDKFLKEILEKGYIWPSQSPMVSPFFFVDKKDDVRTIGTSMNTPSRMPIPYPWLQNCWTNSKESVDSQN